MFFCVPSFFQFYHLHIFLLLYLSLSLPISDFFVPPLILIVMYLLSSFLFLPTKIYVFVFSSCVFFLLWLFVFFTFMLSFYLSLEFFLSFFSFFFVYFCQHFFPAYALFKFLFHSILHYLNLLFYFFKNLLAFCIFFYSYSCCYIFLPLSNIPSSLTLSF